MKTAPVPRERRHTLRFLDEIRVIAPVFLDTEVDMTAVRRHRERVRAEGGRLSTVTCVLHAAARVLAVHPEANAAVRGRVRPRLARYDTVNGKVTLDKTLGGQRVVLATVIDDLAGRDLADVQRHLDRFRAGDPATMPEFAAVRLFHRLPWPLGTLLYRLAVRPLGKRAETVGTFAVTSLGHRPVDGFYSVGGTTITLGLGRVTDRPVCRDGQIGVAPVMRLSLTFDHRVIDGAEAADVLAEIKDSLESFGAGSPGAAPAPALEGER
ncbi:2-oxoacid dehydrogenase/acyltransferase catalytic subunit [Actinomadura pelletieri DSM 43383]|uniref:2-oxoacid dehydrogenase/acyltransferase catalytic subunit n=1 Tax=Actinomadura pelletieri DSM 43383 TaxID=1120940 RepID=A0A495Q9L3_9ACTN|nr:2-oxo acid dehydrogenase subunit E2 [Actinomadura pelletieri]RKS68189.1 2-oxoacid dehydrogenase/acyltransferase catalytic subunit [Actinomadura pelletieri DSM 43383]